LGKPDAIRFHPAATMCGQIILRHGQPLQCLLLAINNEILLHHNKNWNCIFPSPDPIIPFESRYCYIHWWIAYHYYVQIFNLPRPFPKEIFRLTHRIRPHKSSLNHRPLLEAHKPRWSPLSNRRPVQFHINLGGKGKI
jgi:hypothetical protein